MTKGDQDKDNIHHLLERFNNDLERFIREFIDSSADIGDWGTLSEKTETVTNSEKGYEGLKEIGPSFDVRISALYKNIDAIISHVKNKSAELRELAIKDSLTGLYNRHFFNEVIEREVARGERNSEVVSFIMMDLDNLKDINDNLGHLTGDRILVEAAKMIKKTVRKSDMVFRFGGDEFLALMINADCEMTNRMIRRLAESSDRWNRDYEKEYGCRLSFSIGCSTCYRCADILASLNEADSRMYQNKRVKKNSETVLKRSVTPN